MITKNAEVFVLVYIDENGYQELMGTFDSPHEAQRELNTYSDEIYDNCKIFTGRVFWDLNDEIGVGR